MEQARASPNKLPPLPKVSHQSSRPNLLLHSSQRLPVRPTASMESLQLSGSRISLCGSSAMQSMESMDSSESVFQAGELNQNFPVIYNNFTFMVDPNCLEKESIKFKQLIDPLLNDHAITEIKLKIVDCTTFSNRNVDNFLKICQNLPTDVENTEMKEICEIAKMFQAEQIFETGIQFVQRNIDANFNVPDDKYNGNYLVVECENHTIHHEGDLTTLEYADKSSEEKIKNDTKSNNVKKEIANNEKKKSVIYQIRSEKHSLRCTNYHFCTNGHIMYTAKQKQNHISIGEGNEVHFSSNTENHVARMYQDNDFVNYVFMKDKEAQYKIKYVETEKSNHYSLKVSFPYKDKKLTWSPKKPKYDAKNDKYYLNFHGEWHHTPIKSKKNIILQNESGHSSLIVRKMDNNLYEVEAMPSINPLIIFTIGLADIVGPYIDVLNEIDNGM